MKLTGHQIEAVKTWRRGRNRMIVADLPFIGGDEPMDDRLQAKYGGKYHVAGYVDDAAMDFILAATKEMANGT